MKKIWILPALFCGLLALGAVANDAEPVSFEGAADDSLSTAELQPKNFQHPAISPDSPLAVLLPPSATGSSPELMQVGTLPKGWTPDDPLDLSGDMPATQDVRKAIEKAVNYLLDLRNEKGAWDPILTGTLMSATADQAVDAIAATSLAGIALRYHSNVAPDRINEACRGAAEFVIDRVYRGKLPLNVWYANWRYTLGLKFLHMEYVASLENESDDAKKYRKEIRAVSRRMVNAMLRLQLSNSEADLLERKRRARVSARFRDAALPSQLGVVLFPPTDEEYRGGARIIRIVEGSVASESGLRVGDRIVEAEGLTVENAVDYYMQEAGWVAGQKVRLEVKREGEGTFDRSVQLKQVWPAYLGLRLTQTNSGPRIDEFLPFSPCKGEGLEIGDVINELDGEEIKTVEDVRGIERRTEVGDKLRLKVLRGPKQKKRSESVETVAAPEGWFGFRIAEEDKGDDNGVVVTQVPEGTPAEAAGLQEDDRVTWIGDTPILGLDHLIDFAGTVSAGQPYRVKWVRDGEEMEAEMLASPTRQPFDLGIRLDYNFRTDRWFIRDVTRGGAAEKAGFKNGDQFLRIDDLNAAGYWEFRIAWSTLSAGHTVDFTMQRGGKEVVITVEELPKYEPVETGPGTTEEGGWAYYPEMEVSPTFSTAAGMLALMDVEQDLDISGMRSALRDPLTSAANLIDGLRLKDPTNGGVETYPYYISSVDPTGKNRSGMDIRGCQGRNAICELALVRFGKNRRGKSDIKRMIENWVKYRGELDAVRRMEYYNPPNKRGSPHNFDRWSNAAYYWMFGHYHTLLAAKYVGGRTYDEVNEICTKAIMMTRLDDGTWMGHPSFGKVCGTCLALWVLGETEGEWLEGGGDVTTQDKKDSGKKSSPDDDDRTHKDIDDILD